MAKCAWIDNETMITAGTDQMANREFFIWDTRNLSQKVTKGEFPSGVGPTHLYMDHEHRIIYAAFRGELGIGIYQYNTKAPSHLIHLTTYNSPKPTRGFGPMPKWVVEPGTHEVNRFARVDNEGKLEYVSFRLKNRTGLYQDDLYLPIPS